jgi:hypothetical protein
MSRAIEIRRFARVEDSDLGRYLGRSRLGNC